MSPHDRRRRSGHAAMEFGLWLPILFSLFAGMVDISWMMTRYQNVVRAARDGTRVGVAIIEGEESTPGAEMATAAESHAEAVLAGVGMPCEDGCAVEATFDGSTGRLTTTVTYPYTPILGFAPLSPTLSSSFTMQTQQGG